MTFKGWRVVKPEHNQKMPCPLPIFSQSNYLIQVDDINSYTERQTVQIHISWLLQKPTDLDLHCLQKQGIPGFSRTRVNTFQAMGRFSRQQIDDIFLFFPRKQDLILHANCLFCMKCWILFLGKVRKIFQNVFCWNFYLACSVKIPGKTTLFDKLIRCWLVFHPKRILIIFLFLHKKHVVGTHWNCLSLHDWSIID